jgi:NADH dehydrogenase [ubiquinone] 1 alpha subcomplex assembly factor 3
MMRRAFSTSARVGRHYSSTFKASNLGQNLAKYDIYALAEKPENNVEMISNDSIIFSNLKVIKSESADGTPTGALLLNNQIFEVSLEGTSFQNGVVVELSDHIIEVLSLVYPKPELLVAGLGKKTRMLGPKTKSALSKLGIRVETSDTRACALSYDLLATERSPALVASVMLPPNM